MKNDKSLSRFYGRRGCFIIVKCARTYVYMSVCEISQHVTAALFQEKVFGVTDDDGSIVQIRPQTLKASIRNGSSDLMCWVNIV